MSSIKEKGESPVKGFFKRFAAKVADKISQVKNIIQGKFSKSAKDETGESPVKEFLKTTVSKVVNKVSGYKEFVKDKLAKQAKASVWLKWPEYHVQDFGLIYTLPATEVQWTECISNMSINAMTYEYY